MSGDNRVGDEAAGAKGDMRHLRRIGGGATVLALAAWLGLPAAAQSPEDWPFDQAGVVRTLSGEAEAEIGANARALSDRAPVYVDDMVRTRAASRLTLALGVRTTLRLGAETSIRLARYIVDAGGVIELAEGAMLFDRDGPPADTPVEVITEYGLIAVRGTRFFAGPSGDEFGVFVVEGEVMVEAAGERVTIGPGLGTFIATPGAAPRAPTQWPEARVRAALDSVR